MGKGLIKNHIGDGLYEVSIQYDSRRIAKRIEDLTADIARLDQQISEQVALVADLKGDLKNYAVNHPENTVETLTALVELKSKLSSAEAFLGGIRLTRLGKERTLAYYQSIPETIDVSAWCADLTTDLSGTVGLIEVPNERGVIQVRPGYEGRATYDADRDGILQKPAGATPFNFLFNLCIFPGWQKWLPTYRHGVIISLSGDTCNVTVDAAQSSQQGLVINQETALTSVPVEYMNCNGAAFEVGDHVVVQFSGDWKTPKVIGFVESPASCTIYLRIFVNGIPLAEAGHDVAIVHGTPENEIVSPILKTDEDGYVGPFSGIRCPAYCLFHGAIRHESDIYTPLPMTKPIIGGKTVDCYNVMYSSEYLYLYCEFPAGSGNICATILDLILERAVSFDDPYDPVNSDRTIYECDTMYEFLWYNTQTTIPFPTILIEKFIPVVFYTTIVQGIQGYNDAYENPSNQIGASFRYDDEFTGESLFPLGYSDSTGLAISWRDCCTTTSPVTSNVSYNNGTVDYNINFGCEGFIEESFGTCTWESVYYSMTSHSRFLVRPSCLDVDTGKFLHITIDVIGSGAGSKETFDVGTTDKESQMISRVDVETNYGVVGSFGKTWSISAAGGNASYTYAGGGFFAMTHAEGDYFNIELFITAKLALSYAASATYRQGNVDFDEPPLVFDGERFEIVENGGCEEIAALFVSRYKGQYIDRRSDYISAAILPLVNKAVENSTELIRYGNIFSSGVVIDGAQGIGYHEPIFKGHTFRRNGSMILPSRMQAILDLVNAERAKEGIAPLTPNYYLYNAAQRHASDIARHDYRGVLYVDPPPTVEQMHTGTDGSTSFERILDSGYTQAWHDYAIGENIMSQSEPNGPIQDMIDWWMNSPGHRANIMNPDYDEAGMAEASAASGWTYVVNTFGNAIL